MSIATLTSDALEFSVEHCRAFKPVDGLELYIQFDLRDDTMALVSLSNYLDVLCLIPKHLPFQVQQQYRLAVGQRCAELVRGVLAYAPEFDLR